MKVNNDVDNLMFGIKRLRAYDTDTDTYYQNEYDYSMFVYIDEKDKMRNIESFFDYVLKMKMLGKKWEKEHPEKYI